MLARNTLANYLGQGYTAIVGIVVLPLYLRYLTPEEFGLIGFFTLLSSWLQMLTVGLMPTLSRQVAVHRSKSQLDSRDFRLVLRNLELVILIFGLATAVGVWLGSDWIAHSWLNSKALDSSNLAYCISIMGLIAALRWGVSLYSSGLAGMEQQVGLNGFNVAAATLRHVGGLVWIRYVTPDIAAYFIYQLSLSVVELLAIGALFYSHQPINARSNDPGLRLSFTALLAVLPFTLATSYTSFLWIFMTQFDKLIVSNLLPLGLFGYFSFVTMLASGVTRFGDPINQAVLPRLTLLVSRGDIFASEALYRRSTQLLAVVSLSASLMIAVFASQTLFLLSGSRELTTFGAPVLFWFALGNGVLAMASLLFTLQTAHGKLRLHVINSTVGATIQIPLLAYAAIHFGVVSLGIVWFCVRFMMFAALSPIVHRKFQQGSYARWLLHDIGMPLLGAMAGVGLAVALDNLVFQSQQITERSNLLFALVTYGILTITFSSAFSSEVRQLVRDQWKRHRTCQF